MDKLTGLFTSVETNESLTLADLQFINQIMARAVIDSDLERFHASTIWSKIQRAIEAKS